MNNVYFYFHAGSANHGCEAIVRSTQAMLNVRPILFSGSPEQDRDYGLDAVCEIKGKERYRMSFAEKVGCVVTSKLLRSEAYGYDVTSTHESMAFEGNSVALSIGGDNYCRTVLFRYLKINVLAVKIEGLAYKIELKLLAILERKK